VALLPVFFWIASSKLIALKSSTSRPDNPPNYLEIWLWFFLLSNLDRNKHWAHKLNINTIKRWTGWKVNSDNQKDRHNDQFFFWGIRTTIGLQQNGTSKPVVIHAHYYSHQQLWSSSPSTCGARVYCGGEAEERPPAARGPSSRAPPWPSTPSKPNPPGHCQLEILIDSRLKAQQAGFDSSWEGGVELKAMIPPVSQW
jgi:hypothetical protein